MEETILTYLLGHTIDSATTLILRHQARGHPSFRPDFVQDVYARVESMCTRSVLRIGFHHGRKKLWIGQNAYFTVRGFA